MDTDSLSSEAYFFKYIFPIYYLYEDSAYDTFWAFIITYVINSVCFLLVLKFHSFRRYFQSLSPEVRCCGLDFLASRFLLHVLLPLEFFCCGGWHSVVWFFQRDGRLCQELLPVSFQLTWATSFVLHEVLRCMVTTLRAHRSLHCSPCPSHTSITVTSRQGCGLCFDTQVAKGSITRLTPHHVLDSSWQLFF